MKKFELTSETIVNALGVTLFRIKATVDIDRFGVKKGDLGGFIEKEDNLCNAWVHGDAQVYGDAWVSGDARVFGNAWVHGNAWVYDNAWVYGDAWVSGDARVAGNARVFGDAWVYGNAQVSDNDDLCWFSRFGSAHRTTTAYRTKLGVSVRCGYFEGTLDEFTKQVKETHGESKYAREYLAIAEVIKIKFDLCDKKN